MPEHEEKLRKMMIRGDRLTVLDLFCGAGGFSEGFRTAGCRVVAGIDHWRPAVDTFNCNFELDGTATDMLTFEGNEELIESLPDTDIIVGSPPCVSFSYSNKLGNADKTEGLRLIKVFFSIVAIKAFKRNSCLVALSTWRTSPMRCPHCRTLIRSRISNLRAGRRLTALIPTQ